MRTSERIKVEKAIALLNKTFNSPIYTALGKPYYAVQDAIDILEEALTGEDNEQN